MQVALETYLKRAEAGGDHVEAVVAAARVLRRRPWDVVRYAGLLARCRLEVADDAFGLTQNLRRVPLDSRAAIAKVERGQRYPTLLHPERRIRGAFDTPVDMARQVVQVTLRHVEGHARVGLDTACGPGSFLLAMIEAGVPEVYGTDIDPVALEVARVACPSARLHLADALKHGPEVDIVCGNPPFVPPERQDQRLRAELRHRFPWLRGRFDLVIPFAASAVDRVREGGAAGLVLPNAALIQPYGAVLRRRWLARHRVAEILGPVPFPGASVEVNFVVLQAGRGPAPMPTHGIPAQEVAMLPNAPFDPELMPGDHDLVERIRARSVPLRDLALVDTGLVAHGPEGGKARLIHDQPGEGRVPYADAREFFAGARKWLDYRPAAMHRPKHRAMFEEPKVVVQRIRGRAPVRAAVDLDGVYVGHTCTVVQSRDPRLSHAAVVELLTSPLVDGLVRIEHGDRLDLYPRDVGNIPVPAAWLEGRHFPVGSAWGLTEEEEDRLMRRASR